MKCNCNYWDKESEKCLIDIVFTYDNPRCNYNSNNVDFKKLSRDILNQLLFFQQIIDDLKGVLYNENENICKVKMIVIHRKYEDMIKKIMRNEDIT